jgi:hypothetical protein
VPPFQRNLSSSFAIVVEIIVDFIEGFEIFKPFQLLNQIIKILVNVEVLVNTIKIFIENIEILFKIVVIVEVLVKVLVLVEIFIKNVEVLFKVFFEIVVVEVVCFP